MQTFFSESSAEAEYMALAYAVREALWLKKFEPAFEITQSAKMFINEDNNGYIKLAENGVVNARSNDIHIK